VQPTTRNQGDYSLDSATLECRTCRALASSNNVLFRKQKHRLHDGSEATGLSGLFQLVPCLGEIVCRQRQGARMICVGIHERGYPLDSATLKKPYLQSASIIRAVFRVPTYCGSADRTSYESRTVPSPGTDCRARHHTQHGR
jgi:hypothetical protein